jgi:hypothetical protein
MATGQTADEVLAEIEAAFDYRRSITVTVHACAPTKTKARVKRVRQAGPNSW